MPSFSLKYLDKVLSPEAVLSGWSNISVVTLTVALVFYHIVRKGSIKAQPRMAVVITLALMLVSILYIVIPLHSYVPRMHGVEEACKTDRTCGEKQQQDLTLSRTTNVYLGSALKLVELAIAYLIINTV